MTSRLGGDSPGDMIKPRYRKALPPLPLECPSCGSADVDEAARTCRTCQIGIPLGARMHQQRTYVTTSSQRVNLAARNTANQHAYNDVEWRGGR